MDGIPNTEKLRLMLKPYISSKIVGFVELSQQLPGMVKHNPFKTCKRFLTVAFIYWLQPYRKPEPFGFLPTTYKVRIAKPSRATLL